MNKQYKKCQRKRNTRKRAYIKELQTITDYEVRTRKYLTERYGFNYILMFLLFLIVSAWLLKPYTSNLVLLITGVLTWKGYIAVIKALYLPQEITDQALAFYLKAVEKELERKG